MNTYVSSSNGGVGGVVNSIVKGKKVQLVTSRDPVTLHRIFENTVEINIRESTTQQIALIKNDEKILFTDLNKLSNKLARGMIKRLPVNNTQIGNVDGDIIISVCMKPSIDLIVTLLAIWKMGAAYLPLDVDFPKNRIKHILDESKPVMTITDVSDVGDEFTSMTKYSELKNFSSNFPDNNLSDVEMIKPNTSKNEYIGAVLYTSGSTGIPKGVRISHLAILNRLKWQFRTFPYSATEKICVFKTALTFVDSICELWGPLLNGRTLLILSKEETKNPEKLTEILNENQVERLVLVPTLLQSILMFSNMKEEDFLPKLKLWVCSGETLQPSLARKFFQRFQNEKILCNFYGSTEIMGDVSYYEIRTERDLETGQTVPIGKPIDNCVLYILDEHHHPVRGGEIGELYVSGLNLASGYVRGRDPDKFLENFVEPDIGHFKLYKTGDFARVDKNIIYYEGRKDQQIKVRGHRVDLSEIESALLKIDEIDKCVVLTYRPGQIDQTVISYVILNIDNNNNITETEIENKLKKLLPSYMIPQIIIIDKFPLLVNGKIDRQTLLAKYKDENYSSKVIDNNNNNAMDFTGIPEKDMEKAKILFDVVLNVLGKSLRDSINVKSNFYSLGGNSINSVMAVIMIQNRGYNLGIGDFIFSKNLNEIIDKMIKKENQSKDDDDKILNGGGEGGGEGEGKKNNKQYKSVMLKEEHKNDVFDIIASSFYEKADLERLLNPPVKFDDFIELMNVLWPHLLDKNLSFVAIDKNDGNVKGVALNFDAFDEPEVKINPNNKLNVTFEFLEYLEKPLREKKLPNGINKVLHSFMMGSRTNLTPQETIEIFFFMEDEILKLGKERNFEGIFTTNTNPLTQQIGSDVNNYETLLDYQVNEYVAPDGSKPFATALDSQRTIVSWKKI
ncbi:firefly luciferase, putative [Pediculus humanus corporis]|uniref:Firefly luciferase, putative n=1 Tax=Pediculus humanus subsp. corporis TaxID=121224 RepID=E0VUZ0_PEDHC|nr:firefly luciferase, putative [Pediculus humanus corporis]EEB17196.1 firefly luciferase, putative [Pediculus humanus corporis]